MLSKEKNRKEQKRKDLFIDFERYPNRYSGRDPCCILFLQRQIKQNIKRVHHISAKKDESYMYRKILVRIIKLSLKEVGTAACNI